MYSDAKKIDAIRPTVLKRLEDIRVANTAFVAAKSTLQNSLVRLAEYAAEVGCSRHDISRLERERILPSIFSCTGEEQDEHTSITKGINPPMLFTASLSQEAELLKMADDVERQIIMQHVNPYFKK